MSRLRALAANMAAVVTGKAATGVAGLLTVVALTRHLGPTEFGYYRTVLTYSAFAAVLGDSGLYMVTLRRMSQDSANAARVLGNTLPLRILTTGSVLLAAAAVAWLTPYDPPVKWGTLIGAAIYTCLQASDFLIAAFQSVLKQARNAVAEVAGAVVTLAAVSILTLTHVGALPMLAATLLGAITALAISIRLARRLVPFRVSFDLPVWRQYLIAGLPLAGSQILGMAMLRGDSLLLSLFQPAAAVGLYGVSSKLFEVTTSVPYIFAGLMMPALTLSAARDRAEFSRQLGRVVDAAAVYGVGIVIAFAPFADRLLALISGERFAAGAPALIVISFAVALAGLTHVLRFTLVACEQPRLVLIGDMVACTCAFVAYFGLIPRFSLTGAAVGTVIAEATALVGMIVGLKHAGRALPSLANPAKAVVAGALAALTMKYLAGFGAPWLLALAAGGALYLALLALMRAIPKELLFVIIGAARKTGVGHG
ncbi:MAG TPA: oligosaccharide flippase family protein [Steroidobacteraceae bacterium]|nr:oligosaccharide flippase family protein [Steroidobacteraceae bacterium]